MPNQAEQKDRHKSNAITLRLSQQTLISLDELQKKAGLGRQSVLTSLIEQGLRQGIQNTEFQFSWCQFRSLYLSNFEHYKCRKYGYWRTIKTKECIGCLSLETMRILEGAENVLEKRKQEVQELQNRKWTLTAEVQELDANTTTALLKQIEGLKKLVKRAYGLLEEKNAGIRELEEGIIALQNDGLKSSIEPYDKIHSQQNSSIIERITETEKEKITEKFIPQQPQQAKIPSELVLCPRTKETVSFEDVCHICKTFDTCPSYGETVMLKKALGKR